MSQKILFVFNPHSGKGLIRGELLGITDTMVKAGYDVTVYPTQERGDAIRKVEADGGRFDRIVCSGGDGTMDEVVTGLVNADLHIPVGYIPAGSTNDFANSLGIPKGMQAAARTAVGNVPFPCDTGEFNKDIFIYVAAFGIFTEVSYATSQQMKNIFGHLAYLMEGAKHLFDIPSIRMKVETDEETFEGNFIYGMVTNSTSVGGFKGLSGPDVRLDDGLFEGTFIKSPRNPIELSEILTCLGSHVDNSDLIYSFKTSRLKASSAELVSWTLDGEFGGKHKEVLIRNLHRRVSIMVEEASYPQLVGQPD